MNLLGVVAMTALCPAVADTIPALVNFAAVDSALPGRTGGAMTAIVLFAVGLGGSASPPVRATPLIAGTMGRPMPSTKGRGSIWAVSCGCLRAWFSPLVLGYLLGWGFNGCFSRGKSIWATGFMSGEVGSAALMAFATAPRTGRSSLRCSSSPTGSPGAPQR